MFPASNSAWVRPAKTPVRATRTGQLGAGSGRAPPALIRMRNSILSLAVRTAALPTSTRGSPQRPNSLSPATLRRYYLCALFGVAAGGEAGAAAPGPTAGNAAKPLATSSAALASRTFKLMLSSTTTITRWPWRAAVTAME